MMKSVLIRWINPLLLVAFTCLPADLSAAGLQRQNRQQVRSGPLYRLTFTLHIFTGTQDSQREFVMTVAEGRSGRVRALTKVPIHEGTGVTYIETGVKCDAEYLEIPAGIQLEVELQFSEVAPPSEQVGAELPFIYEWQSQVQKTVPPKQKTVLSTFKDEQHNRRYELEIVAERLP
jgi:hypothetical protein